MADTYTSASKARLIQDATRSGAWAPTLNSDALELIDDMASGIETINLGTSTSYSMAALSNGTDSESRAAYLKFTGTPASAVTVTVPASVANKKYRVHNACGKTLTLKYASGTGVVFGNGDAAHVWCDGSEVFDQGPGSRITAAESAASVTPTNYFITASPNGFTNVLRYMSASQLADFFAGTHSVDMTSAFNAACSTGMKVWCPNGNYLLTRVSIPSTGAVYFEGESGGLNPGAVIYVGTNNQGAFRNNTTGADTQFIWFKNFTVRAQSGVTGAKFFEQTSKSWYSAYCVFENIATFADLGISYDGNFISSRWINCIDGYGGTAGATHQAINCIPAATDHPCNNNTLVCCTFFKSKGVNAAVEIAFGAKWTFIDCHFENHANRAILASGIYVGVIEGGWFENIQASTIVRLENSSTPAAQGSRTWEIFGGNWDMTACTGTPTMIDIAGASSAAVHTHAIRGIPASSILTSGGTAAPITKCYGIELLSGAGAVAAFLNTIPRDEKSSFTFGTTGFAATSPTGTCTYERAGNMVTLRFPNITGTSNAVGFTITGLPSTLIPTNTQGQQTIAVQDNGGARAFGQVRLDNAGVITVYTGAGGGAWTNVNAKSADGFNYVYSMS